MMNKQSCNCGLRQHIQKMIDKCVIEMEAIREDGQINKRPPSCPEGVWYDMQEERHEYLSDLERMLDFMLNHTEKEQIV